MRRIGLLTVSFVVLALAGTGAWAAAPAPAAASNDPGGNQVASDLLWLMAGLARMDKEPGLKVTKKQAGQILAVLKPLVDAKILMLDPPQRGGGQGRWPGGNRQNATPEQLRQLRKRRQEREDRLKAAMAAIDQILSAKQVEFIDNMDFDPTPYTASAGGFRQLSQNGTPPSSAQLEQLRAKAQEALAKAAALNRKTYELLVARAAGK